MFKQLLKKNNILYSFMVKTFENALVATRRLISIRYRFQPINSKKIVFDNFAGKGFGGNPKYIAEKIIEHNIDCDLVWLIHDMNTPMPKQIRKVRINSVEAYYELSTASVWIDNVKDSLKPRKRKGQYYIQTWHGAVGIKAVEKDAEESLPKSYLRKTKRDSKDIDLFIAETKMRKDGLEKTFWYKGEVLGASFNRYGFYYSTVKSEVYKYFELNSDMRIMLYVPTFRKDERLDSYDIDYDRLLDTLERVYGGKWAAIVRLHPVIARLCNSFHYTSRIIDGTYYKSIEALISTAEVIITDFSNCMFDAYRQKKMVFLYASDYEEYVCSDRNLYFDLNEMPSPMSQNNDELIYAIENMDLEDYEYKRRRLINEIGYYEDNAAELCCDRIIHLLGEK